MKRRSFVSAALVGLSAKAQRRIEGGFADQSHLAGHRLRDRERFDGPRQSVRVPLVIVGGGMAGLCAAWRLDRRGFREFVILEMEAQAGGNSRWGENEVSAYPWAAHYVPVPNSGMALARELLEEFGVLRDGEWDERHLCHSPQERLYLHGRWQEGLEPEVAASQSDRDQYQRFNRLMEEMRHSGEFRIPVETAKPKRRDLDRLSMESWLRQNRFDSPYLHWLVDYSCRDDYGARASDCSAWAGIHYFASRSGKDEKGPITWPEGNGWIARRLISKLGKYLRTNVLVNRIENRGAKFAVRAGAIEYISDAVIFAAPTFLARYLMETAPAWTGQYSPWLTANLTLDRWPAEKTLPPAWDNVIHGSPALGYVVATHQSLRTRIDRTVWTYYWALAAMTPSEGRRMLLEKDWGWWREAILNDLGRAHPDIRQCVTRIDIMRMGHAMIRPAPGFLFSPERQRVAVSTGRLLFANSDLSGISIFEEAQYRGVEAAERALRLLGKA